MTPSRDPRLQTPPRLALRPPPLRPRLILLWRVGDLRILLPLALLFIAVSTYLLTRPEPTRSRE